MASVAVNKAVQYTDSVRPLFFNFIFLFIPVCVVIYKIKRIRGEGVFLHTTAFCLRKINGLLFLKGYSRPQSNFRLKVSIWTII